MSRTGMGREAATDKNDKPTAQEITTGMETLMTNDSTLNDSTDNDEGFEENDNNVDGDGDLDSDSDDDYDDDDDDDDNGWITPDNISHIKGQMGKGSLDAVPANVTVGCLTTDFAMQVIIIGFHSIVILQCVFQRLLVKCGYTYEQNKFKSDITTVDQFVVL